VKIRVVIEEVVVDAECGDTMAPGAGASDLVKACTEQALKLHASRKHAALHTEKKEGL